MGSFVVYVSAGFGEIVADFRKREGRVFEGRFECGYNFVVDSRGGFNESVVFFFGDSKSQYTASEVIEYLQS